MTSSKSQTFFERSGWRLRRSWLTKTGLVVLIVLSIVYLLREAYQLQNLAEMKRNRRIIEGNPYLIDTPACRIPNLQANSAEAMEYIHDFKIVHCGKPPLVESNDTHLQIIYSVLPKYGVSDVGSLSCCYRPMWRNVPNIVINPKDTNASWMYDKIKYDNDIRYSESCYPFHECVEIFHHFVRIECGRLDGSTLKEFYRDFHAFFPKPATPKKKPKNKNTPLVNVLLLGIDSLSRLSMIRKMPLTYRYITENLKGIPMFGYNKVGLNTFPNLTPLLSGYHIYELSKFCWPTYTAHFDLCPWIWDKFAALGYRTTHVEDAPAFSLFNYLKSGFVLQRTDYDASTMFIPAEGEISHETNLCLGPRNQIEVLLNYTLKQLRAMKRYDENFVTLSWGVKFSHDYLNGPQQVDPLYINVLKEIHDNGILNNTFMIFLSDHGLRFGDFLQTAQGKIEENLPALFFVAPEWFEKKYKRAMQNLRGNQYRLLTTFDLHALLRDLANLPQIEDEAIQTREKRIKTGKGGISVFLPIPRNRSCEEAKIPDEFCACEHLKPVDVNLPEVAKVAQFIVDEINNNILGNNELCVPRTVIRVQEAEMGPPLLNQHNGSIIEYRVSVFTDPGYALFSALVRHFTSNDSMTLVGEISRLNKYGTQSQCMKKYTLLPFCFCRDPHEVVKSDLESVGN